MKQLRQDQVEFVDGVCDMLAFQDADGRYPNRAVLAQAPTGMGKTICGSYLIKKTYDSSKKHTAMMMVHRQELVIQSAAALCEYGARPHVIASSGVNDICGEVLYNLGKKQGEHWYMGDTRSRIKIASIPTLARMKPEALPPCPSLLIVDEAQHSVAKTWRWLIEYYMKQGAYVVGLTGTPERADGQSLMYSTGGIYNDIYYGPSIKSLVDTNNLSYPDIYAPPDAQIDTTKLHTQVGDFNKSEAKKQAVNLIGDVLSHYKKLLANVGPTLVFCVNIEHAEEVAKQFSAAGYRAASVDGKMGESERADRIAAIGDGRLQVLTSCDIISEGLDVPGVHGVIMLRPTMSRVMYRQQIGRAMRVFPGKSKAIIIDHANNTLRHGHPLADDTEWYPYGRTREEKILTREKRDKSVVVCTSSGCGAVNEIGSSLYCRMCHSLLPRTTKRKEIRIIAGELVQSRDIPTAELIQQEIYALGGPHTVEQDIYREICQKHGLDDTTSAELWERMKKIESWLAQRQED